VRVPQATKRVRTLTILVAASLLPLMAIGSFACAGSERGQSLSNSRASTSPTVAPDPADRLERTVRVGDAQTIDGIRITLDGIGLTTLERLAESPAQLDSMREQYPGTQSVVIVYFSVRNNTLSTDTLPIYTSTSALVNDEQLDLDFVLSDVEIDVLPGANVEMYAKHAGRRHHHRLQRYARGRLRPGR
jgi:hypothetical protein